MHEYSELRVKTVISKLDKSTIMQTSFYPKYFGSNYFSLTIAVLDDHLLKVVQVNMTSQNVINIELANYKIYFSMPFNYTMAQLTTD